MSLTKTRCRATALLLGVLCGPLFGCGGPGGSQPAGGAGGSGAAPSIVGLEKLPEVDPPLGPLDDGRLLVAPPSGWYVPSRDSRFVIRFRLAPEIAYPTILVTAADYEPIFNLSAENVEQFAKQVKQEIDERGETNKLVSAVAPILVGERPAVTYQRRAKSGKQLVERYFLETVAGGRRYTIELRALPGTLDDFQPVAWAVLHGMEFLQTGQPGAAEEPSTPPEQPEETSGREPAAKASGSDQQTPPTSDTETGTPSSEEPSTEKSPPSEDEDKTPLEPSIIPEFEEELPPS